MAIYDTTKTRVEVREYGIICQRSSSKAFFALLEYLRNFKLRIYFGKILLSIKLDLEKNSRFIMKLKYSFYCLLFINLLTCCWTQLRPCSRRDFRINICIKNLFNSIYQNARFGRPEYNPAANDLIKMDALKMESQELELQVLLDSGLAKGFKDLKITEVKSDINVSEITDLNTVHSFLIVSFF